MFVAFEWSKRDVRIDMSGAITENVFEQEIVGNIKQFVLYGLGRQEAAINSPEVECGLQQKRKKSKQKTTS